MTDRPGLIVICDAGPVIHLDELGCIDLLSSFSRALIPAAVWQEVQRHRSRALALPCLEKTSAIKPEPPELEAVAVALSLHTGEWEAIRVALEHRLRFADRRHCGKTRGRKPWNQGSRNRWSPCPCCSQGTENKNRRSPNTPVHSNFLQLAPKAEPFRSGYQAG